MSIPRYLCLVRSLSKQFTVDLFILYISIQTARGGGAYQSLTNNILGSHVVFRCSYDWPGISVLVVSMVRENPSRCIVHGTLIARTHTKIDYCEDDAWDPSRMVATMSKSLLILNVTDLRCSDTGQYTCIVDGSGTKKLLAPVFTVPTVVGIPQQYETGIPHNTEVSFICHAKVGVNGEGSLTWRLKGRNLDVWLGEEGSNFEVVRYKYECTEIVRSTLTITVTSDYDKSELFCYVFNLKRGQKPVRHSRVCLSRKLCGKSSPITVSNNAEVNNPGYEPQKPEMFLSIEKNESGYYDVMANCTAFIGTNGRLAWYLKTGNAQNVSYWPFYLYGWPVSYGTVARVIKGEDSSEGPQLVAFLSVTIPLSETRFTLSCTSQRNGGDELALALSVTKEINFETDVEKKSDSVLTLLLVILGGFAGLILLVLFLYNCLRRKRRKRSSRESRREDDLDLKSQKSYRSRRKSGFSSKYSSKHGSRYSSKHGSRYGSKHGSRYSSGPSHESRYDSRHGST